MKIHTPESSPKVRATLYLPADLLEEARDAAFHLAGFPARLTLTKFVEEAFRRELLRLFARDHDPAGAADDCVVRDEMLGVRKDPVDDLPAAGRLRNPRLRRMDVEEHCAGQADGPKYVGECVHRENSAGIRPSMRTGLSVIRNRACRR